MSTDFDLEWSYPHANDMPGDNRPVVVLLTTKDGEFYPDIGRYYANGGWDLQFYKGMAVVAWSNIPDFKDHVEVVEVDETEAA